MEESLLVLPGMDEFEDTLMTTLPYDWQQIAHAASGDYGFVVDVESGLLRCEDFAGLHEYEQGGEYDERLSAIEDDDWELISDD